MNEAIISLDSRSNKWTATFNGKILASSPNKEYVISNITNGRCTKANAVKVTKVREVGQTTLNAETGKVENVERFNINERFEFLTDFVNMVADRTSASLIITGEGGLGKTFTVNRALTDAGMQNTAKLVGFSSDDGLTAAQSRTLYSVVKGYSTAKGLYRTLYENRNRVIIFDDCDSILKDDTALNILKGALDSYDERIISWNAESFGKDDDLPRSFAFKGGVIFISNMPLFKIDNAVRSRAICVDVSMTLDQKIERMTRIIDDEGFLPEYERSAKVMALAFINKMKNETKEMSLRTLISVTKVAGRGDNWERRAEYLLTAV
jgi:hypothetical protein